MNKGEKTLITNIRDEICDKPTVYRYVKGIKRILPAT